MAQSIKRIACIGECMVEISGVKAGQKECAIGFAGDTFNTAVYLKRCVGEAIDVSYVTAIGSDSISDQMLACFEDHQLATNLVSRHATKTPGLYMITTDDDGERHFTYWRDQAAARTMFDGWTGADFDVLNQYDLVYLSAITLAILPEEARKQLGRWIDGYRRQGGLFAFDSNYRPRLWPDQATAQQATMSMWERCDIALPSADDEMALFDETEAAEVKVRLESAGVKSGALKNGASGPLLFGNAPKDGNYLAAENVVDTTAAGDSFNAGFIASIARGKSTEEAAMAGHQLASRVIGVPGAIIPATDMPNID